MPDTTTLVADRPSLALPATMKELVEALIFAASEPLTLDQLESIVQDRNAMGETESPSAEGIETIISVLNDEYQQANRPYRIVRLAGGYQFATTADYAEWIGKLHKEQGRRKLSQSSLETLAIIAYRQPITRPDIEAIRGVDCDYVLGTLLEKKLITVVGRAQTPGRPLLYGTTHQFLKHFGLNEISDLPRPREIEELLADARYETERRMLEAEEMAEKARNEEDNFNSRLPHIPKKKPDLDDSATVVPKKASRSLTLKKMEEEAIRQPLLPMQESKGQVEPTVEESPVAEDVAVKAPSVAQDDQAPASIDVDDDVSTTASQSPQSMLPHVTVPATIYKIDQEQEHQAETQVDVTPRATEDQTSLEHTSTNAEEETISAELPVVDAPPQIEIEQVPDTDEEERVEERVSHELALTPGSPIPSDTVPKQPVVKPDVRASKPAEEQNPLQREEAQVSSDKSVELASPVEVVSRRELHQGPMHPPTDATSTHNVAPPALAPIVDEVREPAQPKSRWKRFKERIQGFLQKVFG